MGVATGGDLEVSPRSARRKVLFVTVETVVDNEVVFRYSNNPDIRQEARRYAQPG